MDDEIIGIFTVVAKDEDREDASDAFLVKEPDLIYVLKDMLGRDGVSSVEVYQDAVPDGNGCRPLPYLRGGDS
jgi:hypothetical protein